MNKANNIPEDMRTTSYDGLLDIDRVNKIRQEKGKAQGRARDTIRGLTAATKKAQKESEKALKEAKEKEEAIALKESERDDEAEKLKALEVPITEEKDEVYRALVYREMKAGNYQFAQLWDKIQERDGKELADYNITADDHFRIRREATERVREQEATLRAVS